jgi:streptomycin 6-kinase
VAHAGLEERWGLVHAGLPFAGGHASVAYPVTCSDGRPAVLKIQFSHRESEHEADALEVLEGDGSVRLLARDDDRHALLLERALPGTSLERREDALDVILQLIPRQWKPAGDPIHRLADEAAWWASYVETEWDERGRPCERRLLDAALDAMRELPATQGEQVLVNQDLHPGNVLAAQREPWLLIDPKPLVGEREFSAAPVVRAPELGHSQREVLARFDRVTGELGIDRERARGWTIAQSIAWGLGHERHQDVARWLLEAA